jgi:hypothetical protein
VLLSLRGSSPDDEVSGALLLLNEIQDFAANEGALRDITRAFDLLNLRVFLAFERRRVKKRVLNKISYGIITFGTEPPPIDLYSGPTGRRGVKAIVNVQKAATAGGDVTLPHTNAGREGNSLGNVSRVLSGRIELFLAGVATWEPHISRLLLAA